MAVIRQQTQVFNQPIGVVRADAADDAVGRAIAGAASDLANLAYREAAINAEQAGVESAGAASRANLVTIDPTTGRPVAYKPPSNFGRLAARSYQNMIDRRFEESINDEIRERGAEIAANSTSAAQYRDRMSGYIQEMYSNAVGENGELNNYGRFIEETGTAYVSSTFSTMREREVQAAREALVRQQNLANYEAMRRIPELIIAGANPEETTASIAAEEQRLLDLYNGGHISISTFSSRMDQLDGFTSQVADNRLINIASSLPQGSPLRPMLSAAIRNPNLIPDLAQRLNIPNLSQIIIEARLNGSDESLISAMTAQANFLDDYEESEVDQFARSITVTPDMSLDDVRLANLSTPEQFRDEVFNELVGQWASQVLNLEAIDENDIDQITNELRNTGQFSFSQTQAIAGPEVARQLAGMSQSERDSLAEQLSGRRAALNAISSETTTQTINALRASVRESYNDGTLIGRENTLRNNINLADIDETTRGELLGALDNALVERLLDRAGSVDGISHNMMKTFRDMVSSSPEVQGEFLQTLDVTQRAAFTAYRDAFNIQPTTTNNSMGYRINSLNNTAEDAARAMRYNGILSAVESGRGVSPEDLEFIDEELDLGVLNASDAIQNQTMLEFANRGYALPSFVRAIETGLRSRNEADVAAAVQLFEVYSNPTVEVENGRVQRLDLLRSQMSERNYALFAAISFVARDENRPPLDVMLEFQSFEEDPDVAIRSDLGLSSNTPLRTLFAEYPMSSNYREEILATMRVRRARGEVFTEDTVEEIIESYTAKQFGLNEDTAVFGPYIGDETVYARTNYFSANQIEENASALYDAMAEDPMLRATLRGGTTADAVLMGLRNSLGLNIADGAASLLEDLFPQSFGVDATMRMSERDRLMGGLQVAGFELKYQPMADEFERGRAVYQVGYVQNGAFQPILINNEPWLLSQQEDEVSSFQVSQAYNNYLASMQGGANREEIRRAEFAYMRTLDHMTDEMLMQRYPDLMEEISNED
jgi:hypothetical protein